MTEHDGANGEASGVPTVKSVNRSPADNVGAEAKGDAARRRARLKAQQARKKRAERERRLRQEQEDRERWEAMNSIWLTRASSTGYAAIVIAIALVLVVLGILTLTIGVTLGVQYRTRVIIAVALFVAGFLFFVVSVAIRPVRRARRVLRQREEDARAKAREAADEISDATDLAQLLRANKKQMEAYDDLARVQARESFRNSQVAIAIGLLVLLSGATVALVTPSTAAKVTTATLTAVGGLLSGYISKTFLRVYERAQQQLTFFFQQPLVTSYILAADRMIERMENDKDKQFARVVDHVLKVLVQLPESWQSWTGPDTARKRARSRALRQDSSPAVPS